MKVTLAANIENLKDKSQMSTYLYGEKFEN